jgi:hypothetical protein
MLREGEEGGQCWTREWKSKLTPVRMRCDGSLEEAGGGRNNWWLIVVSLQVGRNWTSIPRYIKGKYYCKGVDYHFLVIWKIPLWIIPLAKQTYLSCKSIVGQMTGDCSCSGYIL